MAVEEKKHRLEVEEDHGFFHFFLDLLHVRKKEKVAGARRRYHGFLSKKVYEAFKAQWGKPHPKNKKKKVSIAFDTAKQLKEATKAIKEMKQATGTRQVFEQIRYVETLDDKIERVKAMLKRLEYEYLKRHVNYDEYNKRRFEYLEALRFLETQRENIKKMQESAKAGKPINAAGLQQAQPAFVSGIEPIVPQADSLIPPEKPGGSGRRIEQKLEKIEEKLGKIPEAFGQLLGEAGEKQKKPGEIQETGEKAKPVQLEQAGAAAGIKPEIEERLGKIEERLGEKQAEAEKAFAYEPGRRPRILIKETPEKAAELFRIKSIKAAPRPAVPEQAQPELQAKPSKQPLLQTPIDKFAQLLKANKKMSFDSIAIQLGWSIESVERVGLVLEKQGVVDVHYPTIVTAKPNISFVKELPPVASYDVQGKLLREYSFLSDFIPATVRIYQVKEEHRPVYHLIMPYVGAYTQAFFEELKDSIAEQIPIEVSEITDIKKSAELKKRFFSVAKQRLRQYLADSQPGIVEILAGLLLHSMYGLGKIEVLMADDQLEEIAINGANSPITVYHKDFGWMQSSMFVQSEEDIFNYASQIARKVGREITTLNPILDAHLLSGDRINATLNPISSFGNTITIRRFARNPWTIVDFIGKMHCMNLEMASLLWMAMQYEMNLIVAGGTASGKTSCLNSLAALIPNYHRVISIEDVRELMLPKYMHWNWVPLTTRNPNPEGMGEITMLELMQSSLRMRPDRIILGEMRRKKEAEVLFEAMHTGHSVYSTLHADSSQQVLRRLTEPPIELPPLEVEAVDLILVQYRDRRRNLRRTYEISEIESGISNETLMINPVFKWDPRTDEWETMNPATRLIRQLNLHTGMTEGEITKDLESRAEILQWASENNLSDIENVGQIMKIFYSEPELIKKAASGNEDPKKFFGDLE